MSTGTTTGLRVTDLARATGVRPDTIRYYERVGLLAPPPRTSAGYRMYPPSTAERVRFIQGCRRLGLRLREIADLLAGGDTGVCPCEPAGACGARGMAALD